MFSWLPLTIANSVESLPVTLYTGLCSFRAVFCAKIDPTTPGTAVWTMDMLSGTTYQFPRFWSKEVAPKNMLDMSVTEETFQSLRGWLKEMAILNMPAMEVTEETSQEEMSPLKEVAPRNM